MFPSRISIAVAPATEYEKHRALFNMLSAGLSVDFTPYAANGKNYQGLIALSDEGLVPAAIERGVKCYQVHGSSPRTLPTAPTVKFGSSNVIHPAFRSAEITDASVEKVSAIPQSPETFAQVDGQPVWSFDVKTGSHHVGTALPVFAENDFFQAHFLAARWFAMVPLLHFLRQLLGVDGWKVAEPRATFIIDDPNFHHRSYGYLDFAALVEHARAHNYHATVATVPLDAWYFNRNVAALFREHARQISVMMHGVNHLADELAREYTEEEALGLLAVGLRRIAAFEARSGVKVDRIMAAPHGAFKESMAEPMLRLGFEAGCVSIGSLTRWNSKKNWRADLGMPMAQALGPGAFPVFHRTSTNETNIRLSAFLGHPAVIATHHHDYVSNFARIESLAKLVNEISSPRWMTIEDISRTNYLSSVEGTTLCVTPYARRLKIPLTPEIKTLQLMPSQFCPETTINLAPRPTGEAHFAGDVRLECGIANNVLRLYIPPPNPVDWQSVAPFPLGLWAVARRLLAEGRDRAIPMLSLVTSAR